MVVNITTIHFHYQVVTILGTNVHFNSSDVHYSVLHVPICYFGDCNSCPGITKLNAYLVKSRVTSKPDGEMEVEQVSGFITCIHSGQW